MLEVAITLPSSQEVEGLGRLHKSTMYLINVEMVNIIRFMSKVRIYYNLQGKTAMEGLP